MPLYVFDTYDLIKEFRQAGFNEQQAETQAHAAKLVFNAAVAQAREESNAQEFATTRDLQNVESKLTTEINRVESHLTLEIEKVRRDLGQEILKSKNSMIMWMVTLFITQTSLFLGIYGNALNLL